MMMKKHLTTTEAAKLLSVAPDTVLKWVKANKIESYRTPGGHYRIPYEAIETFIPSESESLKAIPQMTNGFKYQYCWEYKSATCGKNEDCSKCIVFKSKSHRCYELKELPEKFGNLKIYCDSTCENCDYYNIVKEQGRNILIITENESLETTIKKDDGSFYKFAYSEYEASLIIESFRPDFIVIDVEIGHKKTKKICSYISEDSRIPFARIVLYSNTVINGGWEDSEIIGWFKPPFTQNQLRGFIDNFDGAMI